MKKSLLGASLFLLCTASLSVTTAVAAPGPVYFVTGGQDSGGGSLRQILIDISTITGTKVITWAADAGVPIALETALPEIVANTILDVNVATGPVTISGPGTISIASATVFQNGSATAQLWTIGTNITGAGSITKTGAQELSLTAANSYTGGTRIDAGTLRINSDAALGSASSVLTFNGGTLKTGASLTLARDIVLSGAGTIDTGGFNSLFSGIISGSGALTKITTGTLTLTGANTFTGAFNINGGTVAFNADAALGTGVTTITDATLKPTLSLTSTKDITLSGTSATLDTNGFDPTFSGYLSGVAKLIKKGAGTLTLSGVNSFSGGTTISEGTLALGANDSAIRTNAGTLTVESGAIFDLRTFTQTMVNFTAPGTTKLQLEAGKTHLAITTNADFSNGTLEVAIAPQAVTAGQIFTPFTYAARTGTCYTSVVSPAALSFTPACNAANLTLTAALVPFANVGTSGNQDSIGRALEPRRTAPSGDSATVLGELYTLDAGDLRTALDQIGPASLTSVAGVSASGAGAHSSAINQRMTFLTRRAAQRPSYAVVNRPSPFPGTLLAAKGGRMGALDKNFDRSNSSWGSFASIVTSGGRLGETYSAAGTTPGYAFFSAGLIAGADYRLDDANTVGASLGFLKGHASLYAPSAGTVDSSSLRYGVYGSHDKDRLHAGLYLGGASSFITARREIRFGGLSRTATGSPNGLDLNFQADAIYDIKTRRYGTISPFAALNYNRMHIGAYSESGAGSLNLSVDGQTAQSMQSTLGSRLSNRIENAAKTKAFIPYLSLAWRHELRSQSRSINASFADGGGSSFSVATGDFARDGTVVGTGFELEWSPSITARLDGSTDFRSHYQNTSVNGNLRFTF